MKSVVVDLSSVSIAEIFGMCLSRPARRTLRTAKPFQEITQ